MTTLDKIIENFSEESFLKADGFDSAVIGYDFSLRLVYSVKECINILISEGMTEEEAWEHFDYNVAGSYVGEKTPVWCNDYL